MKLAELRIRNLQAFDELKSYNDKGVFKYKHPLIIHFNLRQSLEKLLKNNRKVFLEEYSKAKEYEKRYKSYLNNSNRSEAQKENDKENLKKYQDKAALMEMILDDNL